MRAVPDDRPPDAAYYELHRVELASQGDIFRDVPLGYPTVVGEFEAAGERRFLSGPLDFGNAMLLSPSCSLSAQGGDATASGYAHPIRVLAPVHPLAELQDAGVLDASKISIMRRRDGLINYMYLPPLEDAALPESAVLLYYSIALHHDFIADQRVTQLAYEGARQLQRKLAWFYTGLLWERDEFDPPMD